MAAGNVLDMLLSVCASTRLCHSVFWLTAVLFWITHLTAYMSGNVNKCQKYGGRHSLLQATAAETCTKMRIYQQIYQCGSSSVAEA